MDNRKQYTWKKGYEGYLQDRSLDAQKIGEELFQIESEIESFKPKDMVDYARNHEDSELHKGFEWDDSIAGEKYRIEQARYINRILVYVDNSPKQDGEDKQEIRVFYQPNRIDGYRETIEIVRNEDEYQALLSQALAELKRFKKKYSMLVELEEIFKLIG